MQGPLSVEFHGMAPSDSVSSQIEKHMSHLEKLFPRIIDGRVSVKLNSHRRRKGDLFHITIELHVPGETLVVSRTPPEHAAYCDAYTAIHDAFDQMQRKLQDYARKIRLDKKHHESPWIDGVISKIFLQEDYGFIKTQDDREVFFDANAIINGNFYNLTIGNKVRFCEEMGEKGFQATTVHI